MVAKWYCCRCNLLNESTHHNAVFCHCRHHVCEKCKHAKRKSHQHHHHHHHNHHNHDLHTRRPHGVTHHKTNAIHHHHDKHYEVAVEIGAVALQVLLQAAISSALCSIM
ncbi:hypothetical protein BDL97_02G176100 [Sphagnum fallax]|nr:hypothetical protein BDL97_02G176100 [Sphagnum fallax]